MRRTLSLVSVALLSACSGSEPPPDQPLYADPPNVTAKPLPAPVKKTYDALDRATFNRMATRINAPIYWLADTNGNGVPDPSEIKSLLFYPTTEEWVKDGAFTAAFDVYYQRLVAASKAPGPTDARQKLMLRELDGAASVLVNTDLSKASDETREVVKHVIAASKAVDQIYAAQLGIASLGGSVPSDDASQSVFRRDWGPSCQTPPLDQDPNCTAIPGVTKVVTDAYPASLQTGSDPCKKLESDPGTKDLISQPFSVIRKTPKGYAAVPFSVAYATPMKAVAMELRAAADAINDKNDVTLTNPGGESAFKAYLNAAAKGFETNDWNPADEAWVAMNSHNSKFYLRIAPDETGYEPCSQKAGFQVSFAFINQNGIGLQDKLTPVEQSMEDSFAQLVGAPYRARNVSFHLPDFIDVIFNAGEARNAVGATIGESLPNWGPLVEAGKGRTVAMANLYDDPDSRAVRKKKAESLLGASVMAFYPVDQNSSSLETVLHEATHNIGPGGEYKLNGMSSEKAFGGDLSAMLEELKAQTGALYYLDVLQKKGLFSPDEVKHAYVDSVVWGLNHISRGMYNGAHQRKPYSQLAAIQIGFLMDEHAITWDDKATAANGTDHGAFVIDFDRMPKAVEKLMRIVGSIKAKNDVTGAIALSKKYVDGTVVPQAVIAERCLRFPSPNFVYAIDWK